MEILRRAPTIFSASEVGNDYLRRGNSTGSQNSIDSVSAKNRPLLYVSEKIVLRSREEETGCSRRNSAGTRDRPVYDNHGRSENP